jgi:hypothetical protein
LAATTRPASALPPIGVTVLVAPDVPATLVPHILEEADAIWRPALRFVWQGDARLPTALRLVIDNARGAPMDAETPLGWVVFYDARPEPEIHLSYANALALLQASRPIVGGTELMPVLQRDTLLGYAMGRALAHELGHYLFASKAHTPRGLMQTRRGAAELFSRDRSHFQIDDAQKLALAARLTPAPAAASADRAHRARGGR